ncbi:hypothetical protein CEXT_500021 [Caerostris extrusa]|uniref:Uncharacterized protein n=1 Tax=Caerostris extrusa TaxID=172846 RepID=A0AAV4T0Z5_CAEEX|nr:hypothetical protein CEXT_500021 [Caerostris extrusa]
MLRRVSAYPLISAVLRSRFEKVCPSTSSCVIRLTYHERLLNLGSGAKLPVSLRRRSIAAIVRCDGRLSLGKR